VFGLVIAEILRDRLAAPPAVYGGLILYTLATTILPAFVFRRQLPEYVDPRGPEFELSTEPSEVSVR
jgi:hypothetical protein